MSASSIPTRSTSTTRWTNVRPRRRRASRVFGGDGAFIPEPTDPEALTEAELTAGTKLAEETYGRDRRTDNTWVTLAEVDPAQGQRVGDRIVFRLVVDALSGPNGNVYDVALSTRAEENVAPDGLEMFAYTSTVRMPRRGVLTELRFRVPEDQQTLTVGNFDAAFGEAYLTTPLAWYPLIASGQGEMQTTTITVPERDQGEIVAVTLSGGQEYPNDATFYVSDEQGRLLPFELPPRLFTLNNRPIARVDFDAPEVCGRTVSFSGDRTTDPEGDPLEFVWRFGDGTSETARNATHTYAEEGRYIATMEVRDPGPQLGRGSAATVSLFLKEAPVALSEKRQLVGVGEETIFDGSPSTASKWQIATHRWDFGDGTEARGPGGRSCLRPRPAPTPSPTRSSTTPATPATRPRRPSRFGSMPSRSPRPATTAGSRSARRRCSTPAPRPTATARSSPTNGISATATPAPARSCATPMPRRGPTPSASRSATTRRWRTAATTIRSPSSSTTRRCPRRAPTSPSRSARSSPSTPRPRSTMTGRSSPTNGTSATAARRPGRSSPMPTRRPAHYPVTLSVTDDSTTRTATVSDVLSVRVNEPPVAEAGADRRIAIGEETTFDAGASADADGSYRLRISGTSATATPASVRSCRTATARRGPTRSGSVLTTGRKSRTAATTMR